MRQVLSKIRGKTPPPLVLIKGDEPFFHHELLHNIKRHFRSREYELEEFQGGTDKPSDISASLESMSLFGSRKLVVVRDLEKLKSKQPLLQDYVEDPSEGVVAVFEGSGECNHPLGKSLEEGALTYISKKLSPYKGDIEKWMISEAAQQGYTLPLKMATAIHTNVGEDLFGLRNALKKILLHCDDDVVSKEDILAVIRRTATTQTYEFTNALGARNLGKTLHMVGSIYRTEEDPSVLLCSVLLNHLERLIRAKSLLQYGLDPKDAAKVLGMNPFLFQKSLLPQLKRYKLGHLIRMYDEACELDIQIKGTSLQGRTLLEAYLVRHLGT